MKDNKGSYWPDKFKFLAESTKINDPKAAIFFRSWFRDYISLARSVSFKNSFKNSEEYSSLMQSLYDQFSHFVKSRLGKILYDRDSKVEENRIRREFNAMLKQRNGEIS